MIRWIRGIRVRNNEAEFAGQPVAGLDKGEALVVLDQADDIASLTADETLEDVPSLVDVHGRMPIVVVPASGAAGRHAHAIERDAKPGADIGYRQFPQPLGCKIVVLHR